MARGVPFRRFGEGRGESDMENAQRPGFLAWQIRGPLSLRIELAERASMYAGDRRTRTLVWPVIVV